MPNESLIVEIERILAEIVDLGAAAERTKMVPNLLVTNASPAGLTGFITIADDRDGDNILAKKVPGIIYSDNDLVNVLFVQGGEAIAFQQGSQSTNSGLWQIIDGTSTDIFYNSGDVAIGKNTAPDARLELFDTAQAQLRLSFEDGVKFADFTLDTNHDLTITPSSTGQIILQPTADSIDFFQVLDADGGTPVLNVDSTNERVGIGNAAPTTTLDVTGTVTITDDILHAGDTDTKISFTDDDIEFTAGNLSMLKLTETGQDLITMGPGSGDVDIDFNGDMFLQGSDGNLGINTATPGERVDIVEDGDSALVRMTAYKASNSAISGQLNFRAARGTLASPTALADGDRIGSFTGHGNDGAGFDAPFDVGITFNADEAWTATNQGTNISFENTRLATTSRTAMMILNSENYLGVGVDPPKGILHSYLSISGFLLWEYDGLDGTRQVMIPNGTGDCQYRLTAMYVLRDSAAAVASGTTDVSNNASVNLTVGTNTVNLRVTAGGAIDIARTAGSDTIKVSLMLRWL